MRGGAGGWARVKSGFIFPILVVPVWKKGLALSAAFFLGEGAGGCGARYVPIEGLYKTICQQYPENVS
jgi:hypothetical protein